MNKIRCFSEINNVPETVNRYVVARYVISEAGDYFSGSWWFWGSWDDEQTALKVANELEGAVFETEET